MIGNVTNTDGKLEGLQSYQEEIQLFLKHILWRIQQMALIKVLRGMPIS